MSAKVTKPKGLRMFVAGMMLGKAECNGQHNRIVTRLRVIRKSNRAAGQVRQDEVQQCPISSFPACLIPGGTFDFQDW